MSINFSIFLQVRVLCFTSLYYCTIYYLFPRNQLSTIFDENLQKIFAFDFKTLVWFLTRCPILGYWPTKPMFHTLQKMFLKYYVLSCFVLSGQIILSEYWREVVFRKTLPFPACTTLFWGNKRLHSVNATTTIIHNCIFKATKSSVIIASVNIIQYCYF